MKKLRFLLLDANVIIKLFELKLWELAIERCEIVVAETVVAEAQYFEDDEAQETIDLGSDIAEGVSARSSPPGEFRQWE